VREKLCYNILVLFYSNNCPRRRSNQIVSCSLEYQNLFMQISYIHTGIPVLSKKWHCCKTDVYLQSTHIREMFGLVPVGASSVTVLYYQVHTLHVLFQNFQPSKTYSRCRAAVAESNMTSLWTMNTSLDTTETSNAPVLVDTQQEPRPFRQWTNFIINQKSTGLRLYIGNLLVCAMDTFN
jgi:hypothetical protein